MTRRSATTSGQAGTGAAPGCAAAGDSLLRDHAELCVTTAAEGDDPLVQVFSRSR